MVPAPRLRTKARPLITMVMLCPITRPDRHRIARLSAKFPVILAFGLKPERFVGQEGRIDAVLEPPAAEKADLLVRGAQLRHRGRRLRDRDRAAVVPARGRCCAWRWRARCSTPTASPIYETALPPLAGAVLCSLASSLAPHMPSAGVLASLLPELEAELHVFTWLGQRVRAERPRADASASTSPRSAPTARSASRRYPEPSVHKLSAGEPGVPLPRDRAPVAAGRRAAQRRRPRGRARPSTRRSAACRSPRSSRRPTARAGGAPQGGRERRLPGRRPRARRRADGRAASRGPAAGAAS